MMKMINLRMTETEKRVVLVKVEFYNASRTQTVEEFYIVGELPFHGDDAGMKIEFDLVGTLRFEEIEFAKKAFENYGA